MVTTGPGDGCAESAQVAEGACTLALALIGVGSRGEGGWGKASPEADSLGNRSVEVREQPQERRDLGFPFAGEGNHSN